MSAKRDAIACVVAERRFACTHATGGHDVKTYAVDRSSLHNIFGRSFLQFLQMTQQRRRDHHFVPAGILRPWAWHDFHLRAYYWDNRSAQMRCKRKGVRGFCFHLDLLTAQSKDGPSDELERTFESIDTPGIAARDNLLKIGPDNLSIDARCDLARLLMSLELRRLPNVAKVRSNAAEILTMIDSDPSIAEQFRAEGIDLPPSEWYASTSGEGHIAERSFVVLMRNLVDHSETGKRLINSSWHLVRLGPNDGTFVLGDRPLTISGGLMSEEWAWGIPLTPSCALWIRPRGKGYINRPLHFRKILNRVSLHRSERYVFSPDDSHFNWISQAFERRSLMT